MLSVRIHSASRLIVTPSATGRFPRTRGPRSRERSRHASPPFGLRSLTRLGQRTRPDLPTRRCSRYVPVMPADVLSSYPYVVVRVACRRFTRKGSYRLARLAAKYGAEIPMTELPARPSDRSTEGMRRLRLVKGGDA